jgi:hypothetical protein
MSTPTKLNTQTLDFKCPHCDDDLSEQVKSAVNGDGVFEWSETVSFSCSQCEDSGIYREFDMHIEFMPVLKSAVIVDEREQACNLTP